MEEMQAHIDERRKRENELMKELEEQKQVQKHMLKTMERLISIVAPSTTPLQYSVDSTHASF